MIRLINHLRLFFALLFSAGAVLLGCYLLAAASHSISLAYQSQSWSIVAGEVTFSGVGATQTRGTAYWPYVTYRYEVNGTIYRGDRLRFGGKSNSSDRAAEIEAATVKQYPKGSSVQVFYDPASPALSCLEPGKVGRVTWAELLFGLTLVGVGLTAVREGILSIGKPFAF